MKSAINMYQTFYNLLGKPDLGIKTENEDASFNVELWFYLPPSKFSSENTVIYTVGISQGSFNSPCPFIELSYQVPGKHGDSQLEKLGMILGELIYDTLKHAHLTPNLILSGLKRQFMPGMQNMILLEGNGFRPLWIESAKDQHIRILQLLPVYASELSLIRQMGSGNTYRSFISQNIDIFGANRTPLKSVEYFDGELKLAREIEIYGDLPDENQISQQIINWYNHNAPELPLSSHDEGVLKLDMLEDIFSIKKLDKDLLSNAYINSPKDLPEFWERLYSGFYVYKKGIGLFPDPQFTIEGSVSFNA